MRLILNLFALSFLLHATSSSALILPRDLRSPGVSGGSKGGGGPTRRASSGAHGSSGGAHGGSSGGAHVGGSSGGAHVGGSSGGAHVGGSSGDAHVGGSGGGGAGGGSHGSGGGSAGGSSSGSHTYHQGTTSSSGTGRGGSGDTGSPPVSSSSLGSANRNANFFSAGGGSRFTLSGSSIFQGREAGGGERSEVLGTRSYGSGYPYTNPGAHGVVGQPFPFGFWPLYWYGWGHSSEYGGNATIDGDRPGGSQVIAEILPGPTTSWPNTTLGSNGTLYMIGDTASVTTILGLLTDSNEDYTYGCSVQNASIVSMDSSHPPSGVQFYNVIQWYRSSSFALAFGAYNNSYAVAPLNQTAGLDWDDSTPLPPTLATSPFLACVNQTILAALPIIDSDPTYTLTAGAIAGIVLGSVALLFALCFGIYFCVRRVLARMNSKRRVMVSDIRGPYHEIGTQPASEAPSDFHGPEPTLPADEKTVTSEKQSLLAFPEASVEGDVDSHNNSGVEGPSRSSTELERASAPEHVHAHEKD